MRVCHVVRHNLSVYDLQSWSENQDLILVDQPNGVTFQIKVSRVVLTSTFDSNFIERLSTVCIGSFIQYRERQGNA